MIQENLQKCRICGEEHDSYEIRLVSFSNFDYIEFHPCPKCRDNSGGEVI